MSQDEGHAGRLLKFAVCGLLIVFLLYQTYSVLYKPITTATAVYYDTYDGIDITAYFVRAEQLINEQITGSERYMVEEGEKVSKGGTIAEIYADSTTAAAYTKADDLQKQMDVLKSMNAVSDPASVDLDTLNNKIEKNYVSFLAQTGDGCYQNAAKPANELLTLLNKKQVLTGEASGFDARIATMQAELNQLRTGLGAPVRRVTASASGFFVSNVDGLEALLDIKNIDTIDEAVYNRITAAKAQSGFGKIVSDYNWYIVTKMENDEYLNFAEGSSLSLRTSIQGCEELQATVHKVNLSKDKNSAIVVLACNVMNGEIAATRSAPMTIVSKEYSGIRVSNRSVRVVDGKTGVYIVQGSAVRFRPIEVLYSTDTFTLCKIAEDSASDALRLYDEVIEKGKGLYDGKFIN